MSSAGTHRHVERGAHRQPGAPTVPSARVVALCVLSALAVLVGAACSSDKTSTSTPEPSASEPRQPTNGGRLVMALPETAAGWNPAEDPWSRSAMQVARAIFDPLVVYDANNQLQPQLAQKVEPNADFTEWTITIRSGVVFHDGTPVDAAAVRRNLEAQRASALAAPWLAPIKSVYVTSPTTVNVLMKTPWSTFPNVLAGQPGYVASPATLDDPAGGQHPVGSGPFSYRSGSPYGPVDVVKSSTYWQPGRPRLDEVDFRVVADPVERTDALLAGRVDAISTDDAEQIARLTAEREKGAIQLFADPEGEAPKLVVALDAGGVPFVDYNARQAVTLATDRRSIAKDVFGNVDVPIKGPVTPTSPWFEDTSAVPDRDVARARELAADYEKTYGKPLSFSMLVAPTPSDLLVAAAWQRQLGEAGITMEIVPTDRSALLLAAAAGQYQAALMTSFSSWHPDHWYPSLHQATMSPVGAFGLNFPRFGTDSTDYALDDARATGDLARQVEDYRTVQHELVGGQAYVFVVRITEAVAARNDVRDLTLWNTATGLPGLGLDGLTVSLVDAWLDRPTPPSE